ncbi:Cleft lip and palate transmembrane 1 [Arabidopsis suecica]|uniref:Cleft lip and palate transmembrane 1 n=1 Tax=Arabidopsis suecica TaxID=45249 RepID=A0A8T1Z6Q2_ARASU|nr:Cleft lip and palate transmembrane 1 [Arabidopsis suecica]
MAPPASETAAVVDGGDGQQQRQAGGFGQTITGIIRIAVFCYFASKFFSPKQKPSDPSKPSHLMSNLFQRGEPMDMWFYLSEHEKFNDFGNEGALIWHETNLPYAVWKPESTRTFSMTYYPSEALKNNGSLYAHVFFARSGFPIDPSDPEYQPLNCFGRTHPVATYLPKRKADKKKSLLGNPKDSDESNVEVEEVDGKDSDLKDEGPVEWVSYWKPNVTINLVDDFTRYPQHGVPPNIDPYLLVEPSTVNYYPTVFFNEFWLLRDKLILINETVSELPFNLEVSPISMTKWQLFQQIDQSFQIHRSYGSMLDDESDELKRVFLEGNPYLLGVTMFVSMLHSVFDFLAFKNDIQFWNKNKSMEGLSAKSVVLNFICQFIIFLYLLDNDTSWMILASSGVGVCIEFWKIGKAMRIEVDRSGMIPRLRFHDRESYASNKTKEYDDIAIKFLSYVLLLLVVGFSIYSLAYERHKSWYSWILSSLTSCVYMFGFIMMCPQLFINYKLKSVAHLPWRQMTYKFLNTIIDDLFAFVIKMPMLHRLSVFRDDVIFLIYLYQRWVYPVDKTRVNEFGFGGEDESVDTKKISDQEDDKKTN